jgi:hypothetical protein
MSGDGASVFADRHVFRLRREACSGEISVGAEEGSVTWTLLQADVLEALRKMPDCSVDASLSDVPYGLGSREPTAKEIAAYVLGGDALHAWLDRLIKAEYPMSAEYYEALDRNHRANHPPAGADEWDREKALARLHGKT